MVNSLSHSCNTSDELKLHYLDQQMQFLTLEDKATLAIIALYTVARTKDISVFFYPNGSKFINVVELLLELSINGKLALVRAIAEELAVLEQLSEVKR